MNDADACARFEHALLQIDDERKRHNDPSCLTIYRESGQAEARASDLRAHAGLSLGPLDGMLVSLKDVFDIKGEITGAGSKLVSRQAKSAMRTAPVVRRLRAAGAVIVARTNLAEFAFTGVGLNPHFGDPRNPVDPSRVTGGSTSGGVVTVVKGMCDVAIGTDTGGSVRVPAGLCGIVGYKPTKSRIPTDGVFPLSSTFDSVGPLGRSVQCCAFAGAVMAGEEPHPVEAVSLAGLNMGVAQGVVLDELESAVANCFSQAIEILAKSGVKISDEQLPVVDEVLKSNARADILLAEAFAIHRDRMEQSADDIDFNVRSRIERGRSIRAIDYIAALEKRTRLLWALDERLSGLDALLMPTIPIVAPKFDEVAAPESFAVKNGLLVRNTSVANYFDLCAISIPLPEAHPLPIGLMVVGRSGGDRRLLQIAEAVEHALAG